MHKAPGSRPAVRWIVIAALFLITAAATFFLVKFFLPLPLPDSVVGAWRVTNGELEGCTVHFERDGAFRTEVDGKPLQAVVRYDGKHLKFHWTDPATRVSAPNSPPYGDLALDR